MICKMRKMPPFAYVERHDFVGIHSRDRGRHSLNTLVAPQMNGMPVVQPRADRDKLHRRERRAVPETVNRFSKQVWSGVERRPLGRSEERGWFSRADLVTKIRPRKFCLGLH